MHLPAGQDEAQPAAIAVDERVDFRIRTTVAHPGRLFLLAICTGGRVVGLTNQVQTVA
jgi:hypothetical protein